MKNICHSPFDPKILNEVYSIYNYFKYEAGIKYSLEEVYVALVKIPFNIIDCTRNKVNANNIH